MFFGYTNRYTFLGEHEMGEKEGFTGRMKAQYKLAKGAKLFADLKLSLE